MRSRTSITIPLPAEMLDQLEQVCNDENRPRAEVIREALAWYFRLPAEQPTPEEIEAIRGGRDAIARRDFVTLDDLLDDLDADPRPAGGQGA
jgi:predicted transcriptional regulator